MKNELKVLFYLKKNEIRPDGRHPVMGRIRIGKELVQFSTKLSVQESLWDTHTNRAKGKSAAATELNKSLDRINVSINAHYREILSRTGRVTPAEVKDAFQGIESSQGMLLDYFRKYLESFGKRVGVDRAEATLKRYANSYDHLAKFLRSKYKLTDIGFGSLDPSFIQSFDFYLRIGKRHNPNTVIAITFHLRLMVRRAINEGIILRDPFCDYNPEGVKPLPKFLSRNDLEKIMTCDLKRPMHQQARDMFIFACFTGVSYIDTFNLTTENLVRADDGVMWLMSKRIKTSVPFNVPLLDLPINIIEKYRGCGEGNKLFPYMNRGNLRGYLKQIANISGIGRSISFHVGRHTYASEITLSQGVPIESVSSMLGHSDLSSTQIYAKITHEKIEEDMSALEQIIAGRYKLAQ